MYVCILSHMYIACVFMHLNENVNTYMCYVHTYKICRNIRSNIRKDAHICKFMHKCMQVQILCLMQKRRLIFEEEKSTSLTASFICLPKVCVKLSKEFTETSYKHSPHDFLFLVVDYQMLTDTVGFSGDFNQFMLIMLSIFL